MADNKKEIAKGKAFTIEGKRYVCFEIYPHYGDTDEIVTVHLRKIDGQDFDNNDED